MGKENISVFSMERYEYYGKVWIDLVPVLSNFHWENGDLNSLVLFPGAVYWIYSLKQLNTCLLSR